jgi:hypothetical protein
MLSIDLKPIGHWKVRCDGKRQMLGYLIVAVLLLSNVSATLMMITSPRMLCWK